MKTILLALWLALFFVAPVLAGEEAIVIMADRAEYHIGDRVKLKLELKGRGFSLGEIDAEKFAPFEVMTKEAIYDEEADVTRLIITGRIFQTGEFIIPPFVIKDDAGNKRLTEPGLIPVVPLLKGDDETLRPMKPQATVLEGGRLWPWLTLALIIVLLLVVLYLLMRRKKEMPAPAETAPPVPPHIEALRALEEIEALNLAREGRIKEFYSLVADVVRNYTGKTLRIDAMEMTTGELIRSLRERKEAHAEMLESFLAGCDRVKFAKQMPSRIDIEGLTSRARAIVSLERPQDDLLWQEESVSVDSPEKRV